MSKKVVPLQASSSENFNSFLEEFQEFINTFPTLKIHLTIDDEKSYEQAKVKLGLINHNDKQIYRVFVITNEFAKLLVQQLIVNNPTTLYTPPSKLTKNHRCVFLYII
jgi:hypothetical protein